jgi:hypothetical protein
MNFLSVILTFDIFFRSHALGISFVRAVVMTDISSGEPLSARNL